MLGNALVSTFKICFIRISPHWSTAFTSYFMIQGSSWGKTFYDHEQHESMTILSQRTQDDDIVDQDQSATNFSTSTTITTIYNELLVLMNM